MTATHADLDRVLQTLVGHSISAVTYYEIAYEGGAPMWNQESDSFDSLDFGLTLRLDDGSQVSFTWGHEIVQYNVWLHPGPMTFGDSAHEWDATSRWETYLWLPITEATAVWLPSDDRRGAPAYPQSVILRFQSGASVVVSAFESRDGTLNMGMTDHVTVFFDEAEARRLRVL